MSVLGVFTTTGIAKTIDAANNAGFNIFPIEFGISRNTGVLAPSRTGPNSGLWYQAAISSAFPISDNTVKFILSVPSGVTSQTEPVKEIYLFAEDSNNDEFLLALGQPDENIIYDPDGSLAIELQVTLVDVDLSANYVFSNTIATELAEHETSPNPHNNIIQALFKAGLFVDNTSIPFEYKGQNFDEPVEFDGTPATALFQSVNYTAKFNGTEGNTIVLNFDGIKTIDQVVTEWNNSNPNNQVESDAGDGSVVPTPGTASLSGGTYNVLDKDIVYRDVDGIWKSAIADGTIAANASGIALRGERQVVMSGLIDYDASSFSVGDSLFLSADNAGELSTLNNGIALGVVLADDQILFTGFNAGASAQISQNFDAVVSDVTGVNIYPSTQEAIDAVPNNSRILINKLEEVKAKILTQGKTLEFVTSKPIYGWKRFEGAVASFSINFSSVPDNGTWRIEWNGQETADLAYNATALDVETEFNLLPGHTGVTVTGNYTSGFLFEFLDNVPQPLPTFNDPGANEIQRFNFSNVPDDGTIKFEFEGDQTRNIPWDDDNATIKNDFLGLNGIDDIDLTGDFADQFFQIEFKGGPLVDGLQDQSNITVVQTDLDQGGTPTQVNGTTTTPIDPIIVQQGRFKANNLRVGANDVDITITEESSGEPEGPQTAIESDADNCKFLGLGIIQNFSTGIDISNVDGNIIAMRFSNVTLPVNTGDKRPGIENSTDSIIGYAKDLLSQIRVYEHPSNKKRVKITSADVQLPNGIELKQTINNLLMDMDGAEIDFTTGEVFESDGVTPLGQDFSPIIPAPEKFRHASINLIPFQVTSDNRIGVQVLVLFNDSDGDSKELVTKAPLPNATNLGAVFLEGDLGETEITEIATTRDQFSDLDGTYFILYDDVGSVAFWIDVDDSGTAEPAHGADRSVEITGIVENDDPNQVAIAVHAAIDADSKFSATILDNRVTVESSTIGDRPDADQGTTNFVMRVLQQGRDTDPTGLVDITNSDIQHFSLGSGSGGGTGDASQLLTRMEALLSESFYQWLEPSIFSIDEDDKISNSTASFAIVTQTMDFDFGELIESSELLDQEFLADLNDILKAQVVLVFDQDNIDSNPLVELTPNGDFNDLQTVTMEQLEDGNDTFVGEHVFDLSALTKQTLNAYDVSNADSSLELEDATNRESVSQEFTTSADTSVFEQFEFYVSKTGSPQGFLKLNLHDDNAGDPGNILAQILVNITDLSAGNNTITKEIGRHVLSPLTKYHISIETDSTYKSTFVTGVDSVSVRIDSSAPSIADLQEFDGTTWTPLAGSAMVFKLEGRVLDLRLRYTASATAKLKGYGVYYGEEAQSVQRLKRRNAFVFHGTNDNLNEFQLTFDADPDFLAVTDIFSGQTWQAPAFSLQGNKVVFEPDFFDGRDLVYLIARQVEAGSFDANPELLKLAQENHVGSVDPALDRSVPGRGNIYRQDVNGIQKELTLDEFGFITFKDV